LRRYPCSSSHAGHASRCRHSQPPPRSDTHPVAWLNEQTGELSLTGHVRRKPAHDSFVNNTVLPSVAHGGPGIDAFKGGGSTDAFYGGENHDILEGNSGDDTLTGDEGGDTLNTSGDALQDQSSCGTGTDVANADTLDGVSVDCETVHKS
jgi:Ca2+-binding RTX toxin-like protein